MLCDSSPTFALTELRGRRLLADYVKTEKNKTFASDFNITDKLRRRMLLDVKVEDYFNSDESRNFPGRYVHEFCPKYNLCNIDGNDELVDVYVKIEVEEEHTGKQIVVISFHRPEKEVRFAFSSQSKGE